MIVFFLFICLPLLEIAGFVVIGGYIGLGLSLLWVIAAAIAGVYVLMTMGMKTLHKAKASVAADVYPFEDMFDGLCVLVGALLLILPGFISDFLALPLLIAPLRHWIFVFLKNQHQSLYNDLSARSRGFTTWYYEEKSTTIDGDFKKLDKE